MWGEIDLPVKAQQSACEYEDKSEQSQEAEAPCQRYYQSRPEGTDTREPLRDAPAESSCVKAMIEDVTMSGSLVKSQQIGDAELTVGQRGHELLHQYRSRPLVFMERYHACLKPEHLPAFAHVSSDPRAQHYSKVVLTRAAGRTNRTKVRNQRYAALRALQKEGKYFSEEQMRIREPLLYEQYIGQYLTDEEVLERSQEAMSDGAEEAPGAGSGGLAHLLLNSYQERLIQTRLQEEQEREGGAQEEEEDDDAGVQRREWEPTAEEKALLREEFVSQMHQRFLDGKDKDFNYSEVDENPDYDNLDIVSRDAEDRYFDEDDDDEEEEEEEEEDEMEEDHEEENMAE
ncbi:coiled-coil domain-containing protein 97 isoform 2-T2 [Odontesthes bonariensis]|uniref:coiled-coil domain-containing protein 97 isoform X2 n=1 Tax=Odontesthes bonariensis TaxID=219752 RepID=UPI003F589D5B